MREPEYSRVWREEVESIVVKEKKEEKLRRQEVERKEERARIVRREEEGKREREREMEKKREKEKMREKGKGARGKQEVMDIPSPEFVDETMGKLKGFMWDLLDLSNRAAKLREGEEELKEKQKERGKVGEVEEKLRAVRGEETCVMKRGLTFLCRLRSDTVRERNN